MSKRIILCFDGTWNTSSHQDRECLAPTNVYKFYETILPYAPDGRVQKRYYDAGVGTGPWYEYLAGFFGFGLSENIRQGYRELIREYFPGDDIYCIGFSRGAYTARSLIGLIRKVGLLKKEYEHDEIIAQAYKLYRQRDLHPDTPQTQAFRRQYVIADKIQIKFLGVWDTVGSLGIPKGLFEKLPELGQFVDAFNQGLVGFHDTKLSSMVEHAYHAIAIDEHRQPYEVALWSNSEYAPHQKVEQRWFIGAHANVGGGYQDARLSDISLKWMQDKAEEAGLALDKKITNIVGHHRGELRDSYTEALGGLYPKLFGKRSLRKIGSKEFLKQSIDETVLERIEEVKNYRPQNVLDSLSN